MRRSLFPLVMLSSLMVSQAYASIIPGVQDAKYSLEELQNLHFIDGMALLGNDDISNKRLKAMREAALSVGAQNGYVHQMNELRTELVKMESTLDNMFPFKDLMRLAAPGEKSLYYLPPVVKESKEIIAKEQGNSTVQITQQYAEIVKRERLVTSPPDWREYLLIDVPVDVSKPVPALLPKTQQERTMWRQWVAEGWAAGIYQANSEMAVRVRNLGSDFIGMTVYLRSVEEGKITPSYVASRYRKSVNQGNSLHLNNKTFTITADATFNGNEDAWIPLNLDPRGSYRTPDEKKMINIGRNY